MEFKILHNKITEKSKSSYHCLRSADAAILMVNSFSNSGVCGVNYFNTIRSGNTLGTVRKGCALGYYSFGHEVGMVFLFSFCGFLMRTPGIEILPSSPVSQSVKYSFYQNTN